MNKLLEGRLDKYFDDRRPNLQWLPMQEFLELDRLLSGCVESGNLAVNLAATENNCPSDYNTETLQAFVSGFMRTIKDLNEKSYSGDFVIMKYHDLIPVCAKDQDYVPPASSPTKRARLSIGPSTGGHQGGHDGSSSQDRPRPPSPPAQSDRGGFGFQSSRRGRRSSGGAPGSDRNSIGPRKDGFLCRIGGYMGDTLPSGLQSTIDQAFVTAGEASGPNVPFEKRKLWRNLSPDVQTQLINHVDRNRSLVMFNGRNRDIQASLGKDNQYTHLIGNVTHGQSG